MNIVNMPKTPAVLPRRTPRHVVTITAQAIAKGKHPKQELAELAALWCLGALVIKPTVTLAARVLNVSQPLITNAIRELERTTQAMPAIDAIWGEMGWAERDAFIARHPNTIWNCFDRVTKAA